MRSKCPVAAEVQLAWLTVVPVASKMATSSDTNRWSVTIITPGLGSGTVKVTLAIQFQLLLPLRRGPLIVPLQLAYSTNAAY